MPNIALTLENIIHVTKTTQEIAQIPEIDILHVGLLVLDHRQYHDHAKILVLDITIVKKNSTLNELNHA